MVMIFKTFTRVKNLWTDHSEPQLYWIDCDCLRSNYMQGAALFDILRSYFAICNVTHLKRLQFALPAAVAVTIGAVYPQHHYLFVHTYPLNKQALTAFKYKSPRNKKTNNFERDMKQTVCSL